jgi:hypothetical protein
MTTFRQGWVWLALGALALAQGCTEASQESHKDLSIRETGYLQCDVAPNACGDNQMACLSGEQQVDCLEIPAECDGRLDCDCVGALTCPDGACVEVNGGVQCVSEGDNNNGDDNNGDPCQENPDDPSCRANNGVEPCEENPDDPDCGPPEEVCLVTTDGGALAFAGAVALGESRLDDFTLYNCSERALTVLGFDVDNPGPHRVGAADGLALPRVVGAGESFGISLWWQAGAEVDLDAILHVILEDNQVARIPLLGRWQPGDDTQVHCLGQEGGDEQARVLDFGRGALNEVTTRLFHFENCGEAPISIGRYGLEVSEGHEVWFNDAEAREVTLEAGDRWTVELAWAPYDRSDLYGQLSLGSEQGTDTFLLAGRVEGQDGCEGDPDCGEYCQDNPWDPNCPGFLEYCRENPEDGACVEVFCEFFPEDPLCSDHCRDNQDDPNCPDFIDYCLNNQGDERCCQVFPELDYCGQSPCEQNPDDPNCQEPSPEYCLQDAMSGDLGIVFRQAPTPGELVQERFVLRNCGDASITLSGLGVIADEGHDLQLGVGNLFRTRLAPEQEQVITLYWRPLTARSLQGRVYVTLNDGDELSLPVSGEVAGGVDPNPFCLDNQEGVYFQAEPGVGEEVQERFDFQNCGDERLLFQRIEVVTDGHSVDYELNGPEIFDSGELFTLTLSWRAEHEGDLHVNLIFATEQGEDRTVSIYGRVRGDGPPPVMACLQAGDGERLRFAGSPRQMQVVEERFELSNCGQEVLNIVEVWTETEQGLLSVVEDNELPGELGPQEQFAVTLRWLSNGEEGDLFGRLYFQLADGQVLEVIVEGSW